MEIGQIFENYSKTQENPGFGELKM